VVLVSGAEARRCGRGVHHAIPAAWIDPVQLDVAGARTASALPNGHILVACYGTQRVCKMDRAAKIIWEHETTGKPHRARRS
jgi:hypothetical protein